MSDQPQQKQAVRELEELLSMAMDVEADLRKIAGLGGTLGVLAKETVGPLARFRQEIGRLTEEMEKKAAPAATEAQDR